MEARKKKEKGREREGRIKGKERPRRKVEALSGKDVCFACLFFRYQQNEGLVSIGNPNSGIAVSQLTFHLLKLCCFPVHSSGSASGLCKTSCMSLESRLLGCQEVNRLWALPRCIVLFQECNKWNEQYHSKLI